MNKYPFEEHAWNDDLNDTTTWVDGDEAKQAYDAAQSRIQDLEKQNSELREYIDLHIGDECSKTIADLEDKTSDLQSRLAKAETDRARFKQQAFDFDRQVLSLQKKLAEVTKELDELKDLCAENKLDVEAYVEVKNECYSLRETLAEAKSRFHHIHDYAMAANTEETKDCASLASEAIAFLAKLGKVE
jgi:chromosome segregation ATPase